MECPTRESSGGTGDERSDHEAAVAPPDAQARGRRRARLAGRRIGDQAGRRSRAAQARRHPSRRHRRQAREHGSGLRPALLVAPGLPERLQQARLRGRVRSVHPGPREVVEAGERQDLALRSGRQRRVPQRRGVHGQGRRLHLRAHPRHEEQAPDAHLLHADRGRGGGRTVQGALPPEPLVRPAPGHAGPGHRRPDRVAGQRAGPPAAARSQIVKLVYYGSRVVTAEPTPEPSPWAPEINAHKGGPDLAKAKQLMNEAGVGGGLTLTYLVKSQVPVLVKTGEILREQIKKIGITLEVQPLESGQYFEALVGKKFDIAGAWWSVTVDPDMFYNPMQHSTSPWNFTGFKSEEADRRLDAFRYTASPAARKKMYPELVRWFQEEGSLVIFSNEIQRYWMKPNVNGMVPLSSLELRFEDVWLA